MRASCLNRRGLSVLAAALLVLWASQALAGSQADSAAAEQGSEKKARHIRIGGGEIKFDDGSVIVIDKDAVRVSVEEALREAQEAVEEAKDEDTRFRVVRRSDKVRVGDNVDVDIDELINGDVVSVGGNVTVEGKVAGDVVAVFGNVSLESTAVVNGEAVAVFGRVIEEPGSRVRGQSVSVGPDVICGKLFSKGGPCPVFFRRGWWSLMSLAAIAVLILVTVLIAAVFRDGMERLNRSIRADVLKSWLYGLLTEVILFFVTLILVVTIIGIPLAILLWLVVGLACLFAFAGVSLRIGEAFVAGSRSSGSRVGLVFVGALVILIVPIIARVLSFVGGLFWGPALGIRILGSLISWFALTTGLGAVVMTRFGTRDAGRKKEPVAAPTVPAGPEIQQA